MRALTSMSGTRGERYDLCPARTRSPIEPLCRTARRRRAHGDRERSRRDATALEDRRSRGWVLPARVDADARQVMAESIGLVPIQKRSSEVPFVAPDEPSDPTGDAAS